jgi:hypothetical protein
MLEEKVWSLCHPSNEPPSKNGWACSTCHSFVVCPPHHSGIKDPPHHGIDAEGKMQLLQQQFRFYICLIIYMLTKGSCGIIIVARPVKQMWWAVQKLMAIRGRLATSAVMQIIHAFILVAALSCRTTSSAQSVLYCLINLWIHPFGTCFDHSIHDDPTLV